jgi:hypothetical protein
MCPNDRDLPIHASFLESVASPQVKDLVADVAELTLDSITDDETLKAIPVVRTLVAMKGVRERFLLKKMYRFFARLGQVAQEEREAFIAKMKADPRRARKVGETFAVWLDRLDDEKKAELLARVFELYAREEIDFDRSARFSAVIDRAHLPYLLRLRRDRYGAGDDWQRDDDVRSHLLALGLLRITARQSDVDRQVWRDVSPRDIELVKMELNEDGRIFQDHVIE